MGQYWKALKSADKAKFEADAKNQNDKYFAFLATDAGKRAVAARREVLKAKKIKKAYKAVKAVCLLHERTCMSKLSRYARTKMSAYCMFMADNWKNSKGRNLPAFVKEMTPKWKKLSDKEKKPYVDKAISAKTDREAYLKSAAGRKVIRE